MGDIHLARRRQEEARLQGPQIVHPGEIVRTMHGKGMVVATVNFLSVTVSSSLRADAWERTVQLANFHATGPNTIKSAS
jgi:hypothetical protein